MGKKAKVNRTLNILNLFISILVFGTGLILFTQFHVGDGAYREEWLGYLKTFWLHIHQAAAITFSIGFVVHIQMHWKHIKMVAKRWRVNLSKKVKATTREQILLLFAALIVICAGFYPWIAMPGATLAVETYHNWIDVHNIVGIVFLFGMAVHIFRRWQRMFYARRVALRRKTIRSGAE
ncbi:MAG: DUF4405 domain-containing protein [Anaerolineales bacterium]|nr:DUF4405 domain-containing protein [Anaerolineales bacterium]